MRSKKSEELSNRNRVYYIKVMSALVFISMLSMGCSNLLVRDRKTAQIYLRMGQSQLENGNYPEALSTLLRAEKEDPTDPAIQNSLGLAYFVRDRFNEAENHFRRAISLLTDFSEARKNLGRTLIEKGQYKEAIIELDRVQKDLTYNQPGEPLTYLGIAYFKLGDFQKAQTLLRESLNYNREDCYAKNYLGRSYYEQKKYDFAAKTLDNAVKNCKDYGFDEPHYYAALSHFQLGKTAEAIARLEEIEKLYPQGKYLTLAKEMINEIKK